MRAGVFVCVSQKRKKREQLNLSGGLCNKRPAENSWCLVCVCPKRLSEGASNPLLREGISLASKTPHCP